jgi:hypothetical protein
MRNAQIYIAIEKLFFKAAGVILRHVISRAFSLFFIGTPLYQDVMPVPLRLTLKA